MELKIGERVAIYRKAKGYATAIYRNEKGQPTSDRVSIGRYDEKSGLLIPNRNYNEIYQKKPVPSLYLGMKSTGTYMAFMEICKRLGIDKLLQQYFPENKELLLTAAQYMLSEGKLLFYISTIG